MEPLIEDGNQVFFSTFYNPSGPDGGIQARALFIGIYPVSTTDPWIADSKGSQAETSRKKTNAEGTLFFLCKYNHRIVYSSLALISFADIFQITLHQGKIEDILIESMSKAGLEVGRSLVPMSLDLNDDAEELESNSSYPIKVCRL